MKHLNRFTDEYFQKFSTKPVTIVPFDPKTKKLAQDYIDNLNKKLLPWNCKAELIGSTALEIEGKGEIEVGLYLDDSNWDEIKKFLTLEIGPAGSEDTDYTRFNDRYMETDIEIVLTKGYTTKVNIEVLHYLKTHPEAINKYIQIKRQYSYSKRDYYIQKNNFFKKIIENLPDDSQSENH